MRYGFLYARKTLCVFVLKADDKNVCFWSSGLMTEIETQKPGDANEKYVPSSNKS